MIFISTRLLTLIYVSLVFAGENVLAEPGDVSIESREAEPSEVTDLHPRALWPDFDPFYRNPTGLEDVAPGTIIRSRRIFPAFFGFIPDPIEAWQLLYRTTAVNGSAITTATTIFKPLNPRKDRLVAFHTAYDSSSNICSPSYTYQLGAMPLEWITGIERLVLEAYLLSGYIVASPDYEGPDAAFAVGRLQGKAALDGIRAVGNFADELGFSSTTPPVVGVGYSGGSIPVGWAAELQPSYAPEIDIRGWALGGTPASLSATLTFIDNTLYAGFAPVAINGLSKASAYGKKMNALIDRVLTSYGRAVLDAINTVCSHQAVVLFVEQSIFSKSFQSLGLALLQDPTIVSILDDTVLGAAKSGTPSAPVHMYHSSKDQIIPYDPASKTAESWCAKGGNVEFVTLAAGGHVTSEPIGFPGTLRFVSDAFDGRLELGCRRTSIFNDTLDPLALALGLEPVGSRLIELIAAVGKGDSNLSQSLEPLNVDVSWNTSIRGHGVR
ncbi:Secretory lipase [Geosmithia morbida]|uniref:Secretory lipase n=1 Tax=Geosmithia morbida TaxID=1094350 RepID=A0A9P5CZ43_9HYPO|nr:Secretory lipase [Geosmithia morbida]KAF4120047.1 Secretory lipase [Geosmithia morbida]